jgi:hypothetical protein
MFQTLERVLDERVRSAEALGASHQKMKPLLEAFSQLNGSMKQSFDALIGYLDTELQHVRTTRLP